MKIAIDIGHARGTGARGNGLQEHEVAVGLASFLESELGGEDEVLVVDFPRLSNGEDLRETAREVNEWGADICVSLHCDASDNSEACGAHVIYVSAVGRGIAGAIAGYLCELMPGRASHTVRRGDLYILNRTRCPAVLVECGFLTNERDAEVLRREGAGVAAAIAAGLRQWKKENER